MTDPRPDLSVVIVSFEMERELRRTLVSLSPGYQRFERPYRQEVIVVDNGSSKPPKASDFKDLDLDLTILGCATRSPSPVFALNEGLALARGTLIGAWIDGARLASPGLLQSALAAATLAPRPVVATLNWQLGPRRQYLAAEAGYDRETEDRLLASIRWPDEPRRLFDISTSEVPGGPEGPLLESNALFMPRELWQELGGYDPVFDEAGGGAANPDLLWRALELPGTQLIRVVGEGTFHQIHGGLTTSDKRQAMRVMKEASAKYYRVRGRPLRYVRETGILFESGRAPARESTFWERV